MTRNLMCASWFGLKEGHIPRLSVGRQQDIKRKTQVKHTKRANVFQLKRRLFG